MALFGYNAKAYSKNTELMKAQISDLMMKSMAYRGVGTTLNAVLMKFDEYPKNANSKQMEAIDARIFKLIEQMWQDVQRESAGKLSEHANMLLTAVAKSRAYGKEVYPPEQLKAQEMMAECNANIEENLRKKEEISRQMEAIKNKGKKIAAERPNDIELQRLQLQYANLNQELQRADQNLQLWVKQYNNTVRQLKVMEDGEVYTEISATNIQTPAEFARHVETVSAQLNKVIETQDEISGIADSYDQEKNAGVRTVASADDGGFWAAISDNSDVSSDIFGSTANVKTGADNGEQKPMSNPFNW